MFIFNTSKYRAQRYDLKMDFNTLRISLDKFSL